MNISSKGFSLSVFNYLLKWSRLAESVHFKLIISVYWTDDWSSVSLRDYRIGITREYCWSLDCVCTMNIQGVVIIFNRFQRLLKNAKLVNEENVKAEKADLNKKLVFVICDKSHFTNDS